ncbi:MAG TPA: hypothetical protein VH877_06090 [Polyangia bacterium]|jgi:hypothetical protein|nr:hypothetical protein [Polyangia bacterium]
MTPSYLTCGHRAAGGFRSTRDPRLFYLHSRWVDEAAFDLHATLPQDPRGSGWNRSGTREGLAGHDTVMDTMSADRLSLEACMIDGFGSFEEADYRRSWLFFHQVHYVLPAEIAGPIAIPDDLDRRPEFRLVRPDLSADQLDEIIDLARDDAADAAFRARVANHVPQRDLDYAGLLVFSDRVARDRAPMIAITDPVFAVSFLLHKLLLYAARTGAVPIVGREYAAEMLLEKLAQMPRRGRQAGPLAPPRSVTVASFSAGLSFDFLSDAELCAVDFARLLRFKERNSELLERHQVHMIEVAQAFAGLPAGPEFESALERLRTEALRKRVELDGHAHEAWRALGYSLFGKAVSAATAGFFSGVAVLRGHSMQDLLTAAAPAALSAAGVAVVGVVEALAALRKSRQGDLSYLFRARRELAK